MTFTNTRTLRAAASALLLCAASSALAADPTDGNGATTETPQQLPTVSVEAAAPPPEGGESDGYRASTATAGALGKTPLKDAPYSINVTSQDMMTNLQAQTVSEALKYNPTIYAGSGNNLVGGGAAFSIRGFTTDTNESFIDGMRMYSRTPLEDKERIEVLNGPSSFLFGFANPAGTVNYVTKKPTDTPLAVVTLGDYGGNQAYAHGDFGGPLGESGIAAYRMNVLYVTKGDIGIENDTHERYLGSGTLEWRVNPTTTWSLDYSHYYIDVEGGDNIFTVGPNVTAIPSAPNAAKNYMPSYSTARDGYDRVATRFNSDVTDRVSIRGAIAYSDVTMFRHRASDKITNNAGDYTMSRNYYDAEKYTIEGNLYTDVKFSTGWPNHKVTAGINEENTTIQYAYPYRNQTVSFSGVNNIYNPQPYPAEKSGQTLGDPNRTTDRMNLFAATLADQVALSKQWSVILGATRATVEDNASNYSSYLTTGTYAGLEKYCRTEVTPSIALLFKPIPDVSTYVSYNEGLQKGPTAPSTTINADQTLSPYVARQVEGGVKATLAGVDMNAAVFRMERAYAYTSPANIYTEDGRETHIGGEFVATGKATDELTITGGFTVLSASVDKTSLASLVDTVPQAVPRRMARLYAEYAIPQIPGLTLTGGVSYTGPVYVDATNTLSIPSVVTADMGARYKTQLYGNDTTFRFNATNITDQDYWTTTGGSLALGEPLTFTFSTEMSF